VEYAHNAQHEREDAKLAQSDTSRPGHEKSHPAHDDSNCPFHAQLHVPLIQTHAIVLLICMGLLIAFVSQLAPPTVCTRMPARIDCRGPPSC